MMRCTLFLFCFGLALRATAADAATDAQPLDRGVHPEPHDPVAEPAGPPADAPAPRVLAEDNHADHAPTAFDHGGVHGSAAYENQKVIAAAADESLPPETPVEDSTANGKAAGTMDMSEHMVPELKVKKPGAPVESLLRLGQSQTAAGDYEGAITAFFQVLQAHADRETEVEALFGLSAGYRHLNERTRAVAILERLIKDYPESPQTARALLDAGRIHRDLGAERLAMSRFYAVLQATLRIPDAKWASQYKQLARTAQYEIAETHLRAGRYDEAERYFTRFSLLELAPADRARGSFKVIEARAAAEKYEAVINGVNHFIEEYPKDPHVPAALHHAARALRALGRGDEALEHTLRLLQATREDQAANPDAWAYWQRRTGNELANTFFQRGEFTNARQIYDTLAELDATPEWRYPAQYQGALCRERLGLTEEAIEMYHNILDNTLESESPALQEIAQMASWRITHLETMDRERSDIRLLINSLPPENNTASNP